MRLPIMSPTELDNAVFEVITRELGIANAMRFIAQHNLSSDSIDYTKDRQKWLPQEPAEIEKLFSKPDPVFANLVKVTKGGRGNSRRRGKNSRVK